MAIYYLSFQRAPPRRAAPGDVISVSPTIVNDLREEVYLPDDASRNITICFAWLVREGTTGWHTITIAARTIWEGPQSAYKQCQVTVPKDAKDLRLALWIDVGERGKRSLAQSSERRKVDPTDESSHRINISDIALPSADVQILPVLSAPIEVSSKPTNDSTGKSTSTVRVLNLDEHKVEICEEAGYELDKHIWDASLLLSRHLQEALRSGGELTQALMPKAVSKEGLRVIELEGLAGKDADEIDVHLTATDLEAALPLLQTNLDLSRTIYSSSQGLHLDCQALDWTEECTITAADLVLVSDCTYNPTYFEPLCRTIKSLLENGRGGCFCLLAKKHRHADEEALWEQVSRCELDYKLLSGQHDVQDGQWGLWRLSILRPS